MKRRYANALCFAALLFPLATILAQQPPPPEPAQVPDPPFGAGGHSGPVVPTHWNDRNPPVQVAPVIGPGAMNFNQPLAGGFFLGVDGGVHRETGFGDRQGVGFQADGRVRIPDSPWLSVLGQLRNEFLSGEDRFSWTVGGVAELNQLQVALGIDGIYDTEYSTHVGSGFILLSYDLPAFSSRVGVWSTVELWDDVRSNQVRVGPFAVRETFSGVSTVEQTSFFYAACLGFDGCWGEVYVAPGFEHERGDFQYSVGYRYNFTPDLAGYAHFYQQLGEDDPWSFYAGLQFHLGSDSARPWDFVMPQRIRARQRWIAGSGVQVFDPF